MAKKLEEYRGVILLTLTLIIMLSCVNYNVKRINNRENIQIIESR